MNKNIKLILKSSGYILFSVLLTIFVFTSTKPVFATGLESTITDLESQQKETKNAIEKLKEQRGDAEENVDALRDQSKDLQAMYNNYAAEMDTINSEIADVQAALAETSGEIVTLNDELRHAQEDEVRIYNNLKSCLKASYENGSKDAMVMLLYNSKSMQDFLTKTEYVTALIQYEHDLINSYKDLQVKISEKAEELNNKQTALDAIQSELDGKQDALSELTNKVQSELSDTNEELADEKDKLKDYDNQIKDLDKKMKGLQAQQAAAQAELAKKLAEQQAAMAAKGIKEDLSGSYAASASELEWLAATIQAEADGESYTGKLAVGTVIMNRVKSSVFPNTVVGVITQTNQFASYRSGKVELIIAKGPNSTCTQAAQEVLNGARVGEYLFFMTKYYADYYNIENYTMIGNHAFFHRWVTKKPEPVPEPSQPTDSTEPSGDTAPVDNTDSTPEPAQPTDTPIPDNPESTDNATP